MTPILAYLVLALLLAFLIGVTVKHLQTISYAWKIPSYPTRIPFLGHVLLLSGNSSEQTFRVMTKVFDTQQRMTKLLLGPIPMVLVHHPDLLQKVFLSKELYNKPFFYDFIKLGRGLISERCGLSWKQIRKAVNPAFSMKILAGFVPVFDTRSQKMVEMLKPHADGVTNVNLFQYTSQCTLDMVFSTTMGCNLNERAGEVEYGRHLDRIQHGLGRRMLNIVMFFEPIYRLTSSYRDEMKSREYCNAFTDKVVQERRAKLAAENEERDAKEQNLDRLDKYRKPNVFLDEILRYRQDGEPLSDQEVSNNLYTIIVTGNETSALTVCYACLFLAHNPDIQDKVFAEMQSVFHSPSVELNMETLKQLQYTEMVINETLRLTPVAPFLARETGAEIELDGVRIPPGQILIVNFYNLHRRKDFWGDDPERFDPERFRPEVVQTRHPYAFLPFSAGFRNCIGNRYAMNAVKTMLTRLLMAFEVRTTLKLEDMRYMFEISIKLVGPHTVQLVRRN